MKHGKKCIKIKRRKGKNKLLISCVGETSRVCLQCGIYFKDNSKDCSIHKSEVSAMTQKRRKQMIEIVYSSKSQQEEKIHFFSFASCFDYLRFFPLELIRTPCTINSSIVVPGMFERSSVNPGVS